MGVLNKEMSPQEYLEHYGVKGMKWGVRRDNGSGGILQKRAARMTMAQIARHESALSGKGIIGKMAKLDKVTWGGNGRFEKYHNTRISELNNSMDSIVEGKKVARTVMFGPQYTKSSKKD